MKRPENIVIEETFQALAHRGFNILDAKQKVFPSSIRSLRSGVIWRNNSGATKDGKYFYWFGMRGTFDIIGFDKKGRFIGIECKSAKGILSDEQECFFTLLSQADAIVFLSRSYENTIKELKSYGY